MSARNQTMSTGQAAVFGQLAMTLTKVIQEGDIERRLTALEENFKASQSHPVNTSGEHHVY
jgi:hypothetical protein